MTTVSQVMCVCVENFSLSCCVLVFEKNVKQIFFVKLDFFSSFSFDFEPVLKIKDDIESVSPPQ